MKSENKDSLFFITAGLFVLAVSLLGIPSETANAETFTQEHKRLYRAGESLDVGEVLALSTAAQGQIGEVAVTYNTILSRLKAEWLYNGEVVETKKISRGLGKTIRFNYDRPLPGTIAVRFAGASGQIQVTKVAAEVTTMGTPAAAGPTGDLSVEQPSVSDLPADYTATSSENVYLTYENAGATLSISHGGNLLSSGENWEIRRLQPYLYHLRHNSWTDFYWKVNTSRKQVYEMTGGRFGYLGGAEGTLEDITVQVEGERPDWSHRSFTLAFPLAYLGISTSPGDQPLDTAVPGGTPDTAAPAGSAAAGTTPAEGTEETESKPLKEEATSKAMEWLGDWLREQLKKPGTGR